MNHDKFFIISHLARNGREDKVEETTVVFRQPPDEIPQTFVAPYSCRYEGQWYRENEEFRTGVNDCSVCICIDTEVKCNDDNCTPPTTTTTTSTTQAPLPATTPFVPGPIGEIGARGDRGDAGEPGVPVCICLLPFMLKIL